jgi:hypothetical protein
LAGILKTSIPVIPRAPETVNVETDEVSIVVRVADVVGVLIPPTVMVAQVMAPRPCSEAAVLTVAELSRVMPALTLSVTPEFTVTSPPVLAAEKVMDVTDWFAFTVTIIALGIVAASAGPG